MSKKYIKSLIIFLSFAMFAPNCVFAAITEQQGKDLAEFAKNFIEQGNERRDEKGYPLLTYALSGNWNTCIEIRNKGYNEELYYVKNNGYHIKNGRYVELGNKWCMDCGKEFQVNIMNTKTCRCEMCQNEQNKELKSLRNSRYYNSHKNSDGSLLN
jgi:hypothetical protein